MMASPRDEDKLETASRIRRPSVAAAGKLPSAPTIMTMNGHFATMGDGDGREQYSHGIQVVNEDKEFK